MFDSIGRPRVRQLVGIVLVFGMTAGVALSHAQTTVTSRVDRLFAQWDRRDSPGCALVVIQQGHTIFARGYGMADLERDIPITSSTSFYVGSLSKQFTAMAVLLLAQQGALSLDDDARKYLDELPDYGVTITIRHLLTHTSGLPEYPPLLARAGWPADAPVHNSDVLDIVARERRLDSSPGDRFSYSNTGYTLLGIIAERVARVRLDQFAATSMFSPLNMRSTLFYADTALAIQNRAYAYEPSQNGWRLGPTVPTRVGAGGIFTTVEDLARWDANFDDGRVGGGGLIAAMTTPARLNNGEAIEYGFGVEVRTYHGHPVVEHGGDLVDYHAYFTRFPDAHLSVGALCNVSTINLSPIVHAVADIYLETADLSGQSR